MPRGIPKLPSFKQNILHRLKITRGHLNRVIDMVESDRYCIDIVHQSMAVQAALKKTDEVILKNHMETCVADAIGHGRKNEVIAEIVKVLEKK
ncbi:hypothetical protein A2154_04320 [Candidatus Gottesmanbacteria bacterium RBG_16_43_7]|uniref:Copper-sensing transcriptional repressor CsoR n=1 Tax=Candidatus Gottesmanbacteria bacterium RBG_16_43_7 TaxID=1798373 RepID=A0A1F5ZC51_9BACT|nr:MAG: hypothetical protein A2154_04320 [Candidatus Gottesmanbacteria bacterium RBG_16_43_7]